MDANIQAPKRRQTPAQQPAKPYQFVQGAMAFESRATIAKAKAEAMRELENIDYKQAPQDRNIRPPKVWKRSSVRSECRRARQSPLPGSRRHKPKQGKGRKLTDFAASLPKPSATMPMLFHLLRRFVDKQPPGNKFEAYVFERLSRLEGKHLDSLVGGLERFESVKEPYRATLFDDRFDHWSPQQPVDSSLMHWAIFDESITLKWGRGLDALLAPGKVRPWKRVVGVGDFQIVTAPWPWINKVDGLRTADHIQAIDLLYFTEEYEFTQSWVVDQNSGQPILTSEKSHYPACSVTPQQDRHGNCLRVADVRVGGSVTLTGFNFFSKSAKVNLTRFDGNVSGDTFVVDGFAIGDLAVAAKDDVGDVIADHRVNDKLMFDIPTMTTDGLYEFPPGIYAVSVTMPNDVHYTSADGNEATEFTSNTAYLRVLPSGNEKYRVWSDQAHCYDPTDGEWGRDELALDAIAVTIDAATNSPMVAWQGVLQWGGVDDGESTSYSWNLFGSPGQPEPINGFFALGLLGWEVDSEDSLNDNIRGFGAAFTQYWGIMWGAIVAVGGAGAAVGIITSLFAGAAWWVALVAVAIVLIVATIVGLIWAAWAPADRIIVDIIGLSETQLYYLTSTGASPPQQNMSPVPDIEVTVTPDPKKVAYLYVEERRYDCINEGSSYGFQFKYERDS